MLNNKNNYYNDVFLKKLSIGELYEDLAQKQIIKYYENKNKVVEVLNICCNNKYDFELTNRDKYEVKADIMALKTNNIFVEFIQFNKPSNIEVTKAKYYIFIVPFYTNINYDNNDNNNHLFMRIKTKRIKQLINNKKYDRIINPTDNNNNTGGYLFKLDVIKENSRIIN